MLRQGQGLRRRFRERPRDGSRRLQDLRQGRDNERGPGPERRLRPEGRPRRGRRVRDARRREVQGGALQVQGPRSRWGERCLQDRPLFRRLRARRDLPREVRGGQGLLRDLAGVRQPGGGGRRGRGGGEGQEELGRGGGTRRGADDLQEEALQVLLRLYVPVPGARLRRPRPRGVLQLRKAARPQDRGHLARRR